MNNKYISRLIRVAFLSFLGLFCSDAFSQGSGWNSIANFGGTARQRAVSFSISGKGYVGTGWDGAYKKDFWEYNPTTNSWTQKADFGGTARDNAVGFATSTKGYIGTGYDGTYKSDLWEYVPSSNTWAQKTSFPGAARRQAVAFSIGNYGYIGTGYTPTYVKDFWEYDSATDTWVQKTNFGGSARYGAVGFSISGKGYVGTGYDGAYKNDFWEWDQATNVWTQKSNIGTTLRVFSCGFSVANRGYIATGLSSTGAYLTDTWEYNPNNNVWLQKNSIPGVGRHTATGFGVNNKVYIGTGYSNTSGYLSDFYVFDQCATISSTTSSTDATCAKNDGAASVSATNGYLPYTYYWSPSGQTTNVASELAAGTHSVTITDDNGCKSYNSAFVNLPSSPKILSVNALNAYAGDTITLSGLNFGNSISSTIIYFGRVKTTPILINDSIAKVTVPPGAAYDFISLINNCEQIAYSPQKFNPLFYCADPNVSTSTFSAKTDISGSSLYDVASADLDGDGRNDIVATVSSSSNSFFIYHNTGSGDVIYFSNAIPISTAGNPNPQYVAIGDLDADGKQDLVISCNSSSRLLIYKNQSIPGSISFSLWGSYYYPNVYAPAIADIDFDGKPDIIIPSNNLVLGLRNIGSKNNMAFVQKTIFSGGSLPSNIYRFAIADIDGDNRVDISLVGNSNLLYVLKNNSSIDNFNFFMNSFPSGFNGTILDIEAADFDNDGKLDILVPSNNSTGPIVLFQNNSTATTISFNKISIQISGGGSNPRRISVADINSDNFPDFSVGYSSNSSISILKNNGNNSFSGPINFGMGGSQQDVLLVDLNNNGKPDMVSTISSTLSYFRNQNLLSSPSISTSSTNVSCYSGSDGTATAATSNGNSPYSYSWSNGLTGSTTSGLSAGVYQVTSTDSKGCVAFSSGSANAVVNQPDSITISSGSINHVNCNGASTGGISITVSGGVIPYTYLWSNGVTTQNLSSISAGNYTVTATDNNNCKKSATFTVNENTVINPVLTVSNISCNGACNGSISSSVSGGVSPYTYQWSTGATTANIGSLCPGTYSVTVTDNKNCSVSKSEIITQPALLTSSVSKTDVNCNAQCNGTATATGSGGTSPYTYTWSNNGNSSSISGLCAGTYTVTITDANNCISTNSVTVNEPGVLSAGISSNNVTCNALCNGSATANASSGTSPYAYSWSNNATSATISGLCAGSYSVTVTDNKGCTKTATVSITEPSSIVVSTSSTDATCGNNDGSVSVSVSGGISPYSYQWGSNAGNQTTATATGLTSGAYSVTVTDTNNCTRTATASVNDVGAPVVSVSISNSLSCNGNTNGSIIASVSGGTTPYSYLWNDSQSQTTQEATGLAAGNYTVVVTDAINCSGTAGIQLTEPANLSVTLSNDNISCNGLCDGSVSTAVSGGTTPYSYSWQNGNTASAITGLCSGVYPVTITDANNCSVSANGSVLEPVELLFSTSATNIDCYGNCNGAAMINNVGGGVSPYTYSWNGGESTSGINNLCAGTYSVTVSDANNCSKNASVLISEPPVLAVSFSKDDVSCNGSNNAVITANVSGGTSPYSYLWSNGSSSALISGLSPGYYIVTITDSSNCSLTDSVLISEPSAIAVTTSKSNISCFGQCDGVIAANVSGGISPYNYNWSSSNTTSSINSLCSGVKSFTLTVTDANSCQHILNITDTITEPQEITTSITKTSISCNGFCDGSFSAVAGGGVSPYNYQWSAANTGLCAGNYTLTLTVTDSIGCVNQTTINDSISQPDSLTLTLNATNACGGSCSGAVSANITGGVSPYSYNWSGGQSSSSLSALCAGNYSVIITDNKGCVINSSATVSQSPAINLTFFKTDVTCSGGNDGNASVSVSGGTPPNSYLWSNGATTGAISNLGAGTYDLTVTDSKGCTSTGSVSLVSPTAITMSFNLIPSSCTSPTGSASVSVSGGTGPYSYQWSSGHTSATANNLAGGNYTITVTDNKGCKVVGGVTVGTTSGMSVSFNSTNINCNGANNGSAEMVVSGGNTPYSYQWSNGSNNVSISGLSAGTYSGTATDANGCSISGSVSITQPPAITIAASTTNASTCGSNDGSITLNVSGGTLPYSYSWSNGATTSSLTALGAGSYIVTVTTANGCKKSAQIMITAPSSATLSFSKTDAKCFGDCNGSVTVSVTGGTSPFSYMWSNGKNTASVSGLCSGSYTVTVVESNGCTVSGSVTISQPTALNISVSTNSSTCGLNNGSATVSASGGITPYTYQWSSGSTATQADSLASGTYIITVTDNNGCKSFKAVNISDASGPNITVTTITPVTCNGGNNGGIDITVSGGNTPYTYKWSNGKTTEDLTGLTAGPYEVSVTSSNGCVATKSINVTQPAAIIISITATNASCGMADGSLFTSVSGGTSPYNYVWSTGHTSSSVTGLGNGSYAVTVTDNKGCSKKANATISETGGPQIIIDSVNTASCGGSGDVFVSVSGGNPPFAYNWSNGLSTEDITGVPGGVYNLFVSDYNGCTGVVSVDINDSVTIADPICLVTVDSLTGTNKIVWQKTSGQGIKDFKIYRETSQAGVYQLMGTIPFDSLSTFTDPNASPLQHSWRYKLSATDSCGNESVLSTEHKTIHLVINVGIIPNTVNLIWDHYQGFAYNSYYIYRYSQAEGWKLLDSLASSLNSYTDNNLPASLNGLFYIIEARHPNGCTATKAAENHNSSRSNVATLFGSAAPLSVTASVTDATQGNCDGTAAITASGGKSPYSYSWNTIPPQTTQTATGLCAGNYSVTVTDSNGDTISVNVTIGTQPGIQTTDTDKQIKIYPNPARNILYIEGSKAQELRIIDLLGRELIHNVIKEESTEIITLFLDKLSAGMYYLQIKENNKIHNKPFVIE
jgi:hypothetical protein